ncbi:hypothetical protein H8959_001491 [Pygathrix nigripes]
MNNFQAILTQVRILLSSHQPSQVQALLDNLLKEELLSREYHCTLLHEPDSEALARKISLTLLEKGDLDLALLGWARSGLQPPAAERGPSHSDHDETYTDTGIVRFRWKRPGSGGVKEDVDEEDGTKMNLWYREDIPGSCSHPGSSQCATMELGPLEGSYLELLNSDADPLCLYHIYDQMDLAGEEEIELYSEPDTDTINCDQFSRLLCDMEGDEETKEAYANIAELDQYVFQDSQLEGLSKDIFIEHIGPDEVIGDSMEMPAEVGQKSQKRPFPEELPADLKHWKPAEPPTVVTGSFLVGPVSSSSTPPCLPLPALFNQEPASSRMCLEETDQMPMPSSSSSLSCLNLPEGPVQFVPTISTLPQGLWQISGTGTGVSSIFIYHGEVPQASQVPPPSGLTVHGLPTSPDRPGSTSPFAPSATDLPSMPEPALTSRANVTEPVEQFYRSLQDTVSGRACRPRWHPDGGGSGAGQAGEEQQQEPGAGTGHPGLGRTAAGPRRRG